jgi:hypothetical protein
MLIADVKLGLRVRRHSGTSALVRDNHATGQLKGRRTGIIISLPEAIEGTSHRQVRVQWEGSTMSELVLVQRLEALPLEQQPIALGGSWTPDESTFVVKRPAAATSSVPSSQEANS